MNRRKLNDELSAYLDGESNRADEMRALLERDPEAARQYRDWTALSKGLKALPAPEVHPAFATRVMARVRRETAPRRPSWWLRSVASLAVALVVAAAVTWYALPGPGGGTSDSPEPPAFALTWTDEEQQVLLELVEARLREAGPDAAVFVADVNPLAVAEAMEADINEAMRVWLAESDVLPELESTLQANTDVRALFATMDEEEEAVFRGLLLDYALEG